MSNNLAAQEELPDIQRLSDTRGISLQRAGVSQLKIPLTVAQKDGEGQVVQAEIKIGVSLPASQKGTHMSRFVTQIGEWSKKERFTFHLKDFLEETLWRLQAQSAHVELTFNYFIEKAAPVSGLSAPMPFRCTLAGTLDKTQTSSNGQAPGVNFRSELGVVVPISTLCPCSKAIAAHGAHNQRALISAKVLLDTQVGATAVWIEDLVAKLETCSSAPVYPVLKRPDEKFVTEQQYENPKFVEDVARDAIEVLRDFPGITGYSLDVETLESIHEHNAWAHHSYNFEQENQDKKI